EDALKPPRVPDSRRAEQDTAADRCPTQDLVRPGMIGQSPRRTTASGHDIDIRVAIAETRVSYLGAIRGELGPRLNPVPERHLLGFAPVARHAPEMPGKGEDDPGAAQRRAPQQQRGRRRWQCRMATANQ